MNVTDLLASASVFLDANVIIYHFAPHPTLAQPCTELIQRIENKQVAAFTSTHVLSEAAHHLMTFEASMQFGWQSKIVEKLKQQPAQIGRLAIFRQAIEKVPQLGIQVLTIPFELIAKAAGVSIQHGLLSNDALLVAVMQAHGLTDLASHDADFDRIPGITRYGPV